MSDSIFREGGPHNIKRTGLNNFTMDIKIPPDEDGYVGKECPHNDCSPAYFKVKLGTGITEKQEKIFCPYCRHAAAPDEFHTDAQKDYAKNILMQEVEQGAARMIRDAFGLDSSGKRKLGGGFLSIEMSLERPKARSIGRPIEEELRRDVLCPHCGLEHAVFGLATWCSDCGKDIFMVHVAEEFRVIQKILGDVDTRKAKLGARVAARDVENALEDTVSIFEAVSKIITRSYLRSQQKDPQEIEEVFNKQIRNSYQNISTAIEAFRKYTGAELFDGFSDQEVQMLKSLFEKRHPITHNLGVVDRKYLGKAMSGDLEGREVRVLVSEVMEAIDLCLRALQNAYSKTMPMREE